MHIQDYSWALEETSNLSFLFMRLQTYHMHRTENRPYGMDFLLCFYRSGLMSKASADTDKNCCVRYDDIIYCSNTH